MSNKNIKINHTAVSNNMNTYRMLMLVLIAAVCLMNIGIVGAATITVDYSGGADYTSIQAAIDDASPGDEIHVDSGTYYENVNVIKQLTLRGVDTGAGLPVVDAMQTGSPIALIADYCTVDGFVVTNNSLSNIGKLGSNAGIYIMSNGNIISNISSCNNKDIGIYLEDSSNNNLFNNIIFNNHFGIVLKNSSDNFIIGNKVFNNTGFRSNGSNNQPPSSTGILITGSNNIMKNNNVSNNYIGIGVINRGSTEDYLTYNNTIENNTIFNNSIPQVNGSDDILRGGILIGGILNGTSNDTLKNNSLIDNEIGIRIKNSKDLTISENSVASSNTYGLLLINSSNSDINNNYIYGCAGNGSPGEVFGIGIIMVESSHNNNLSSNNVSENWNGIFLIDSSQNILDNNTANNNIYAPAAGDVGPPNTGFYIENSSGNVLINNNASNNNYGMFLSNSAYNTLINNTANNNAGIEGEDIYFSSNGILLTDSSQNTLSGNMASNNSMTGIGLKTSNYNTLIGNNASNNIFGIGLKTSSNNKLSDNNVSNNSITGIPLNSSSNNTLSSNTASNNNYGIWLGYSSNNNMLSGNTAFNNLYDGIRLDYSSNNNTLSGNTASNNDYGVYLISSSSNILYHNNLVDNTIDNAYDTSGNNQWDNAYPSGGNYWSDYSGEDQYSGPNQTLFGSDGIGDVPYDISGGGVSQDRYPLMQPWNECGSEFISIGSASAPPNSTITIPVNVANVTNISGISFNLLYNSSVVTVSSVSANESFTGSSITPNIDNVNGITNIVLTNSNLISASAETPVIDIAFNITGESGSSTSLDLQNVKFSDANSNPYTPAIVVDGMIAVGIKGDFNGNGRVDIGDVAKVAFMVAGKVPEDLNADFNGNGRVDIGDAAKIAFYLAGNVSVL